jgi:hypothetical protein
MTPSPVTTARPRRARWVLPEDGIVDELAVAIAAAGTRPVPLTRTERWLAARRILATGGTPYLISERLHVSGRTALAMAAAINAPQAAHSPAPAPHPDPERQAA